MNGQVYKWADLQTTAAGMRAAIAAVAAVVVGTAAADPFFEDTGRFKDPSAVTAQCDTGSTTDPTTCPYDVSEEIVCSSEAAGCVLRAC